MRPLAVGGGGEADGLTSISVIITLSSVPSAAGSTCGRITQSPELARARQRFPSESSPSQRISMNARREVPEQAGLKHSRVRMVLRPRLLAWSSAWIVGGAKSSTSSTFSCSQSMQVGRKLHGCTRPAASSPWMYAPESSVALQSTNAGRGHGHAE